MFIIMGFFCLLRMKFDNPLGLEVIYMSIDSVIYDLKFFSLLASLPKICVHLVCPFPLVDLVL